MTEAEEPEAPMVQPEQQEHEDPRAPVFFLSYAHTRVLWTPTGPRKAPSRPVLQFFEDLSENVNELTGRAGGAYPGFIDRKLTGGQLWEAEILEAVGTCNVLVSLLSDQSIDSDWCGKEWDAFAKRPKQLRPDRLPVRNTAILPVLWTPMDLNALPSAVLEVQLFTPQRLAEEIVAGYHTEGVLGLRKLGRNRHYGAVVWRLAQEIVTISRSFRVEPSRPALADLRNVFKEKD